jgi:hypothetical protein
MSRSKKGRKRKAEERRRTVELPPEKGFYFYRGLGGPLGVSANSFVDFQAKLAHVEPASVKFHVERGDFQSWFRMLGEAESAEKVDALKGLPPDEMKGRLTALLAEALAGKRG